MFLLLAKNWWAVALRGLFAMILGALALIWPGVSVGVLVVLFGAYALVDGIFAIISGVVSATEREPRWGLLLIEGVFGILAGVATFLYPGVTLLVLMYLIGAWAIVTGGLEVAVAIQLRRLVRGEWLLGLSGAASIVLGAMMLRWPGAGVMAVVWMIGCYGILYGALLIGLGFRLHSLNLTSEGSVIGPAVHSSGAA